MTPFILFTLGVIIDILSYLFLAILITFAGDKIMKHKDRLEEMTHKEQKSLFIQLIFWIVLWGTCWVASTTLFALA
jgi:hypothetical protein